MRSGFLARAFESAPATQASDEVRGPSAVRDYILELHGKIVSQETSELVVSDGHAYLEGDLLHVRQRNIVKPCVLSAVRRQIVGASRPRPSIEAGRACSRFSRHHRGNGAVMTYQRG